MSKLHKYEDQNGNFDYDKYVEIQTWGNKSKLDFCWVAEQNIRFLAEYIQSQLGEVAKGVCHGTRQGFEQKWFSESLGIEVIGTEISDTASQFPNTIQWDFHEPHPDLIKLDFVYSNSFDHSYDPEKSFTSWVNSLRIGGLLFIEHSKLHEEPGATQLDPFGASAEEIIDLARQWCGSGISQGELLDMPAGNRFVRHLKAIVFQRLD
ncbi:MAG: class I SAM-dependent methyltransferase [Acidiferrobacterales bacterium]|nr:class I SAM-dependent methyltransferase [Acidiferrobacterales bacterium]